MKVRVEKDIVIPAGMILHDAPRRTVRYEPFAEALDWLRQGPYGQLHD